MITGCSHVNLVVTDLEAARRFYVDTLGFAELPRPDSGSPGHWLQIGDLELHLSSADTMPDFKGALPHLALRVPRDAYEATVDALREAGVEFVRDTRARDVLGVTVRQTFIADPAGNVLELTDAG